LGASGRVGEDVAAGARNLLRAAGACPGERVLLVGEAGPAPRFDPALCALVAEVAQAGGMVPGVLLADPGASAEDVPAEVVAAMAAADRVVFFSRIGDQLRFRPDLVQPGTVMAYVLETEDLGSPFATADHAAMARMHDVLAAMVARADSYRISAPCGTALTGRVAGGDGRAALTDFALALFPVMIFPPVTCVDLSGVLVLDRFVTSTATRAYDDSVLRLDRPLRARIEGSRIVALEGPQDLVARLEAQLQRAAALTGGDPWAINSWHAGINPNTFYRGRAEDDPERWDTVAFGSPRYAHFHAAGRDPGDVAFHLLDATIAFDGVPAWEDGRFVFLDRPEVRALAPGLPESGQRLPIGL
jgi:hypothetical protein